MKKALFMIKRRTKPMLAAIVELDPTSGRKGKVLASEPVNENFSNADLSAAARRLVPQVKDRAVILPTGVEIGPEQ